MQRRMGGRGCSGVEGRVSSERRREKVGWARSGSEEPMEARRERERLDWSGTGKVWGGVEERERVEREGLAREMESRSWAVRVGWA